MSSEIRLDFFNIGFLKNQQPDFPLCPPDPWSMSQAPGGPSSTHLTFSLRPTGISSRVPAGSVMSAREVNGEGPQGSRTLSPPIWLFRLITWLLGSLSPESGARFYLVKCSITVFSETFEGTERGQPVGSHGPPPPACSLSNGSLCSFRKKPACVHTPLLLPAFLPPPCILGQGSGT